MPNEIVTYEGYGYPKLRKSRRRRYGSASGGGRRFSPAVLKMQDKMKSCALKWRKSGKRGGYRNFIKDCLRK